MFAQGPWFTDLSMFPCACGLGHEPEGELSVGYDVHPGAEVGLAGYASAQLLGVPSRLSQQQPCQVGIWRRR